MLYDMHCHLDFSDEGVAAASAMYGRIAAFSATVDPRDFDRVRMCFAGCAHIRVGLGLHPWQASSPDFAEQVDAFASRVSSCAFVGEVGLDFSPQRASTRDSQVAAFDRIVRACVEHPVEPAAGAEPRAAGGIVSIHAVRAVDEVVDVFVRAGVVSASGAQEPFFLGGRAPVIHSFNGASDQLQRAVKAGFFFSVGPRLLATKRGRAYVRAIPRSRLLLETDMPSHARDPFSAAAWQAALEGVAESLAAARGEDVAGLCEAVSETSARILGF